MIGHYAIVIGRVNYYAYRANRIWLGGEYPKNKEGRLMIKIREIEYGNRIEKTERFSHYETAWEGYLPFDVLKVGDEIIVSKDEVYTITKVTYRVDGSICYETDTVIDTINTPDSETQLEFAKEIFSHYKDEALKLKRELEEYRNRKNSNTFQKLKRSLFK